MVKYDYRCRNCESEFEIEKNMNNYSTKEKCPNCKSKNTIKIIKPVHIIYKGSGFTKSLKNE